MKQEAVVKTTRAAPKKKAVVSKITELAKQNPVVGLVDMQGLPAAQLQQISKSLRGMFTLVMTRKKLIERAVKESGKAQQGVEKLLEKMPAMPGILFTKENPFKLAKLLEKNKTPAPAKAGQTAPKDLVVPAGPTPFTPGPVISELSALGLKTAVEGGKITIRQDTVVCKQGEAIKPGVASLLLRLGIEPMEIGINLTSVYEKGMVYDKEVLTINEAKIASDITKAAKEAFGLAVEIGYFTPETTEYLVEKAQRQAIALSEELKLEEKMQKIGETKPEVKTEATTKQNGQNVPSGQVTPASREIIETQVEKMVEEAKKQEQPKPTAEEAVKSVPTENDDEMPQTKSADTSSDASEVKKLKEEIERENVEKLTQELLKKGTLRK